MTAGLMRIAELEVFRYPVPFKTAFRHASATRRRAENLIVAARSDCGRTGYGEGCPRSYVTGETVEGGARFVREHRSEICDSVTDIGSLRDWIETNRKAIDRNPAAFCAVEIAILDLIGQITQSPVEDVLGVPRLGGDFVYAAVLGDAPWPVYCWQLLRYRKRGFGDFKVKLSGELERDRAKLRLLRKVIDGRRGAGPARVRLDANNLWTAAADCISHMAALPGQIFAIEEPLQPGDLAGLAQVAGEAGTRIILDESILRVDQLRALDGDRWVANVRVSKMGGLNRSLAFASEAAQRGLGIIVGAQVGETSILTRAGLTVMGAAKEHLLSSEGAFGTHLLRRDLTTSSLMFGRGGVLRARDADVGAPGLGLSVRDGDLSPL